MSRLIDKIGRYGVAGADRWLLPTYPLGDYLNKAVVVSADNVAEFYFTGTRDGKWEDADFPNVAPRFPLTWIEMRRPSCIRGDGLTLSSAWLPEAWGVLLEAIDTPEEYRDTGVRWGVRAVVLAQAEGGRGAEVVGHQEVYVSQDGRIARGIATAVREDAPADERDLFIGVMHHLVGPALLTLCFWHCRNVRAVDCTPPQKLSRAHERRGGRPLVAFKTLIIDPMKQTLRTEGRYEQVGIRRAMHICSGHFKDYRDGAGLFGKYHKLVYVPAHVKGSTDAGAVAHDFRVARVAS